MALLLCLFIHIYFVSWPENLDLYYRKFYFEMACNIRTISLCRNISLFVLGLKFELFWVFYVMTFAMCFWILLLHIFVNFCTLRAKQLILCWYQKNVNVQYLVEKTCFYIVIYLPYEPSWYFYTEYSEWSELHLSICFNFEIPTSMALRMWTFLPCFLGNGPDFIIHLMQSIFLWM